MLYGHRCMGQTRTEGAQRLAFQGCRGTGRGTSGRPATRGRAPSILQRGRYTGLCRCLFRTACVLCARALEDLRWVDGRLYIVKVFDIQRAPITKQKHHKR